MGDVKLEYAGPPEPDWFDCGYCGGKIMTLWAPNNIGMLQGEDHCLMGDEVWHNACLDDCLFKYPIDSTCGEK